jgi:hypothetical protein
MRDTTTWAQPGFREWQWWNRKISGLEQRNRTVSARNERMGTACSCISSLFHLGSPCGIKRGTLNYVKRIKAAMQQKKTPLQRRISGSNRLLPATVGMGGQAVNMDTKVYNCPKCASARSDQAKGSGLPQAHLQSHCQLATDT